MPRHLVLFLILFVGAGGGVFLGLLVCANVNVGNFSSTDHRKDLVRCLFVALITAATGTGLLALTSNPRVILGLLPVWYITVKLCWLELEIAEIVIVAVCTLLWITVVGTLARAILV